MSASQSVSLSVSPQSNSGERSEEKLQDLKAVERGGREEEKAQRRKEKKEKEKEEAGRTII